MLFNSEFWGLLMFLRIRMVLVSKLDSFASNFDVGILWIPEGQMPGYYLMIGYLQGAEVE
jgi:hypothetical protein